MSGITDLHQLIASMRPHLCEKCYVFTTVSPAHYAELSTHLHPKGMFVEDEGITLICEQHQADSFKLGYQGVFKQITLSVHSSLEAVGLTAAFASALGKQNISANVLAGYYHDHIFVAEKDANNAIDALEALSLQYQ